MTMHSSGDPVKVLHEEGLPPLEAQRAESGCSGGSWTVVKGTTVESQRRSLSYSFGAAVCIEDEVSNDFLCADVPVRRTEQRETPAFPVHGVMPGRERHVSPS